MSKGRKVIRIPMRGPQHPKQSIPRQKNLIDAIDASGGGSGEWTPTRATRADLPPTREQIMADPRVMALVGALEGIKYRDGCGSSYITCHDCYDSSKEASAALAALTDNEGETE